MKRFEGKTIKEIGGMEEGSEGISFTFSDGSSSLMQHTQDCCESVELNEIVGDINDLVDTPIVEAEEVNSADHTVPKYADSYTWTFYNFRTIKGDVTLRWLGESNGYYSEEVSLDFYDKNGDRV